MTAVPISQPFDLKGLRSNSRAFGVIVLTISIALGIVAHGFWEGHFARPAELDTLPLEMLCTGGALLFFTVGISTYFSRRFYRVDPLQQTIRWISGGVFGIHYGKEIRFNQLAHVRIIREDRGSHNNKAIRFLVCVHLKSGDQKQVFL